MTAVISRPEAEVPIRTNGKDPFIVGEKAMRVIEAVKELSNGNGGALYFQIIERLAGTYKKTDAHNAIHRLKKWGILANTGRYGPAKCRWSLTAEYTERGFILRKTPSSGNQNGRTPAEQKPGANSRKPRNTRPSEEDVVETRRQALLDALEERIAHELKLVADQEAAVEKTRDAIEMASGDAPQARDFRETYFEIRGRTIDARSADDVPERLREVAEKLEREVAKAKERLASLNRKKEFATEI